MPNSAWVSRVPNAAFDRAPQRIDRSMAAWAAGRSAGQLTHWSNCIEISAPSRSAWISIERSGVSTCLDPSIWLEKVTASSVSLEMPDRDMT